jgi:hypothetical protein
MRPMIDIATLRAAHQLAETAAGQPVKFEIVDAKAPNGTATRRGLRQCRTGDL